MSFSVFNFSSTTATGGSVFISSSSPSNFNIVVSVNSGSSHTSNSYAHATGDNSFESSF